MTANIKPNATPPTYTQRAVYDWMVQHLITQQRQPTMGEVAEHFGWASANAAHEHAVALICKGWLVKQPMPHRGFAFPKLKLTASEVTP